jgi:hypothetical protein
MADGGRGEHVYTYRPGETISVRLVEFVPHPGYFRVAFDADGDDAFVDPVSIEPLDPTRGCPAAGLPPEQQARDMCDGPDLYNSDAVLPGMDNLMPHVSAEPDTTYEFEITLPDVECDNCTLQIIQVMEDPSHGPYNVEVSGLFDTGDIYYQCIDLVLQREAGAAGGKAPQPGASDHDASADASPGASAGDGGCAVMRPGEHAGHTSRSWLALGALAYALRRRRRAHWQPGAAGSSMHV